MSSPDQHFRLRVLRVGVLVTLTVVAAALPYALLTWERPHRGVILVLAVLATLDALAAHRLLVPRAGAPWMPTALAGWTVWHIAATTLFGVLDGGLESPFVGVLFLCIAFAGSALRPVQVPAMASLAIGAVVVIGAVDGADGATVGAWGVILAVTAAVCALLAYERQQRLAALDDARGEMLRRLAIVVEHRDNETGGHIERMAAYCAAIAARLGLAPAEVEELRLASTMHDIGKVAIPDAILLKPGALTPAEREVMQRHAAEGHAMLTGSATGVLDLAATIALTHHERHDGAGYPRGLRGGDIPVAGRIAAVGDVFDALTSDRVYKSAMPFQDAVEVIRAGAGTQFHPAVVEAFLAARAEIAAVHAQRPARGGAAPPLRLAG